MDRQTIEAITRTSDPYLWIDEVVQIDDDQIHARKYLSPEMPIFGAHFANFPLFPGALQCEAAFQASAVLLARTLPSRESEIPVIARVRDVQFRQMVRPGDTIDVVVTREEQFGPAVSLRGRVSVGDQVSTRLAFVATQAAGPEENAAG